MKNCGCENCNSGGNWPALAAMRADDFVNLVDKVPDDQIRSNNDLCVINLNDKLHYYIRVVCEQKIKHTKLHYEYGPWVKVEEDTFIKYTSSDSIPENEPIGIGLWNTNFPWYDDMHGIPCKIYARGDNYRPIVEPDADYDHQFVLDFYNRITEEEVKRRVQLLKTISGWFKTAKPPHK